MGGYEEDPQRCHPIPECTALMNLYNGVLISCSPLWCIYFRRNMKSKVFLHFIDAVDKDRVSAAVGQFMSTGKMQSVPHVLFGHMRSKTRFTGTLLLTDAQSGDSMDVRLQIHEASPLSYSSNSSTGSAGTKVVSCFGQGAQGSQLLEPDSAETRSCPAESEGSVNTDASPTLKLEKAAVQSSPGMLETDGRLETTPAETMQLGLVEVMHHVRTEIKCCEWHSVLAMLQLGISELKRDRCDPAWASFSDWQCRSCKAMNELTDQDDDSVCGVCGNEGAQIPRRVEPTPGKAQNRVILDL